MAPEFFGHRPTRRVRKVSVIGGDFRKLVSISAPTALERKVVERKNHDAAAQVVVGDVDLVSRLVNSNFFDSSHDHRRGRRILLSERRLLSRCVGRIAAAATSPATGVRYSNEAGNGSGA